MKNLYRLTIIIFACLTPSMIVQAAARKPSNRELLDQRAASIGQKGLQNCTTDELYFYYMYEFPYTLSNLGKGIVADSMKTDLTPEQIVSLRLMHQHEWATYHATTSKQASFLAEPTEAPKNTKSAKKVSLASPESTKTPKNNKPDAGDSKNNGADS